MIRSTRLGPADVPALPPRRPAARSVARAASAIAAFAVASASIASMPSAVSASPAAAPMAAAGSGGGSFANPSMESRPMYRFWSTGGLMTQESIERQVAEIKSSGAGGFEANNLPGISYLGTGNPGYDAGEHGFGTPAFSRAWAQLFQAGADAGLQVDTLYTPGWSAGIQDLSPDETGTAKELVHGSALLDGGEQFAGPVPTVALPGGVTEQVLQGVVAYRCHSACDGAVPVLDAASAIDLTASVVDGSVAFTAPAGGEQWVLVGSWMQGTGQTIFLAGTKTPSYMVDHFGDAGASAIIDYWEDNILTPELRAAMRKSKGSIFFDSLELNRNGETVHFWTDDFLTEFEERRGYSLVPYLAALGTAQFETGAPAGLQFEFDGKVGDRVRQDYQQTLSDLFIAHHIEPLKTWAHGYEMTVRGQAYIEWGAGTINDTDAAIALDIPEQEANNRPVDGSPLFDTAGGSVWRQIASANAQVGRVQVSTEAGTFGRADGLARRSLVARMNLQFALGMNKVIYHGWPDQSPGTANQWPGYFPFRDGAPDNYGVQVPTFADDTLTNDYVARTQTILRRGTLSNDVAVFWDGTGVAHFGDEALTRAGYTYGFMNNTLVNHDSATLTGNHLTDLGYRAIVLDGTSSSVPMELATAKRIRSWARAGLPVVVVGDLAHEARGLQPSQDKAVGNIIDDLLAQDSVITVTKASKVPAALAGIGVNPSVAYDDQPLISLHRTSADSDYYYLFNSSQKRTATTVTLTGEGRPYRYDAWTGQVTPVTEFTRTAHGVEVDVDLATGESDIIAMTTANADTPQSNCALSVTDTNADDALVVDKSIAIRDTQAGTYATTLSDGRTTRSVIDQVDAPTSPTDWDLQVTSWHGGPNGPADTAKTPLAPIQLSADEDGELPNWQEIDGLESISGTSTYTTTIDLGDGWTGGTGATLDLGEVLGTVQVSVNGTRLPAQDQTDLAAIDLGGHLQPGENTVSVHVATPVYNAAYNKHHAYGLVGPVTLTPYGQATVAACATRPPAVIKQATTTSLKVKPTRIKAGKRAKATIHVRTASGDRAAGAVQIVIDGKKAILSTLTNGKATLRLPKLKVGQHKVRVRYLGTTTTEPSTAKVVRVRVVRR